MTPQSKTMTTHDMDELTHQRIMRSSGLGGGSMLGSLAKIGREVSGGVVLAENLAVQVHHGLGMWCVVFGVGGTAGNDIHK